MSEELPFLGRVRNDMYKSVGYDAKTCDAHELALKRLVRTTVAPKIKGFADSKRAMNILNNAKFIVHNGTRGSNELTTETPPPPNPREFIPVPVVEIYDMRTQLDDMDRLIFMGVYHKSITHRSRCTMYYVGACRSHAPHIVFSRMIRAGMSLQADMPVEQVDRKFISLSLLNVESEMLIKEMIEIENDKALLNDDTISDHFGVQEGDDSPCGEPNAKIRSARSPSAVSASGSFGACDSVGSSGSNNSTRSLGGSVSSIISSGALPQFVMRADVPVYGSMKFSTLTHMLERMLQLMYCRKEWGIDRFDSLVRDVTLCGHENMTTWQCARVLICVALVKDPALFEYFINTEVDLCMKLYSLCQSHDMRTRLFYSNGFDFNMHELVITHRSDDQMYFRRCVQDRMHEITKYFTNKVSESESRLENHAIQPLVTAIRAFVVESIDS